MSLIHWWPLNGNTNDNGIDNFTLSNTPSFEANGKIGKCATNTSVNAGQTYLSNQTLPLASDSPISIFTWVYMNDYSTTGANLNGLVSNHNHGHNGDTGSGFGLNLRNNGNSFQVSISTSSTSGRTYSTYCGNTTFSAGEWHHVGFTYNGSRINFYLDGNYDGGLDFTSSYNSNNPIGIFCWSTGYSSYSSSCRLNDVRVYNHALSVKEVKEISKGLILHYNFEDEYVEPTTNLVTGLLRGGNTSITDNAVITNGTNSDTYFYLKFPTALIQGTTYTISCDADIPTDGTGTQWKFGMGSQSASDPNFIIKNGHNEYTFVCTANSAKQQLLFDDMSRIYGVSSKFYNFQVEQKDHATPYVNGTRSVGKVYDNSGYGNNGTVTGSPQITSNTGIGLHSCWFDGQDTAVQTPNLADLIHDGYFTLIGWFMHTDDWNNKSYETLYGGPSGFEIESKFSNINSPQFVPYNWGGSGDTYHRHTYTLNEWHQWAMIRTPSETKFYFDGEFIFSGSGAGSIPSGNYFIGAWNTYSQQNYKGYIGDFKIYSTALSANDIKAEYNRKAAIDKNGNLFTGKIVESNGSAPKIDKNNFLTSNLFAATMTLEDGSIWVPICIHYVPDGLFTGANRTFYYTGRNIWTNFGAINDLARPESGQWEFYVMQQSTVGGAFSKYRFKQNISPLNATWNDVNPSKVGTNVTRISSSTTNNYAGMYWYNTDYTAMCFANTSNGNWFGCGVRKYWGSDYTPGYNGEQVRGWQLVYMRVSKHKARMFKNGVIIPTNIIEN